MASDAEDLFTTHLSDIQRIVKFVCRSRGLDASETEEFLGHAILRLLQDDYAIIRRFEGRSSLRTYLTTVTARLLTDYQIGLLGKWNPSAKAKRLGPVALELERLLYRDYLPIEEALAAAHANHPEIPRETLQIMAEELPPRMPRRHVSLDEAASIAEDPRVSAAEHASSASSIVNAVRSSLRELPPEDRLLLRLRFATCLTVPEIARSLNLKPFQVYQRLDRRLRKLRTQLEAAGVHAKDVREVIGTDDAPLEFLDIDYDRAFTRA